MLAGPGQWTFRVAHYAPWLFQWWMTQKWFPSLSIMAGNMAIFCPQDLDVLKKLSTTPSVGQVILFPKYWSYLDHTDDII